MKYAKLVTNGDNNGQIISAYDVLTGVVDKNSDFEDIEEEFRVIFVSSSKNHGVPYFRLYVSKDEYDNYSEDKKIRYDILKNMRYFKDGPWHKAWEERVRTFAELEHCYKNSNGVCKRADATIKEKKLVIEFQHSFISRNFKERNNFYTSIGIKTIWLFDVTQHNVVFEGNGYYKILEDNSNGFFRVEYDEKALDKYNVYIQSKDGKIYRIKSLLRKEIRGNSKSTIRYFRTDEIYSIDEFVSFLRDKSWRKKLYDIWSPEYSSMIAYNYEKKAYMKFYNDKSGNISRCFDSKCIGFNYVNKDHNNFFRKSSYKFYSLKEYDANMEVWERILAY